MKKIRIMLLLICLSLAGCSSGGKDDNTYSITATLQSVDTNGFFVNIISDTSQDLENGATVYCFFNKEIEINAYISDNMLFVDDVEVSENATLQMKYLYHYLELESSPISMQVDKIEIVDR